MELFNTLKNRHSVRSYLDKQISNEDLEKILLAGNMAPIGLRLYSSMHLTVIQNEDLLHEISSVTAVSRGKPQSDPLFNAPTLIVVSSNDDRGTSVEYANTGCIIENMALVATALGLGSIFLLGVVTATNKAPETLQKLNLPDGYKAISALAVGYASKQAPPPKEEVHHFKLAYIK